MYPLLVGNELKNQIINEILDVFKIERSLIMKGALTRFISTTGEECVPMITRLQKRHIK